MMTDDEEPGWAKVKFRQSPDDLRKNGPSIRIRRPDLPEKEAPYYRVRLIFPWGPLVTQVVELPGMNDAHGILLGRDVLGGGRLGVDFLTGVVRLQIRTPEVRKKPTRKTKGARARFRSLGPGQARLSNLASLL